MSKKRIIGIAVVISVLLISYKLLLKSNVINLQGEYKKSGKFKDALQRLEASGESDLITSWQGLDAIPDAEEIQRLISLGGVEVLAKTGERQYEKGSWGDIAQWMRIVFNYPEAYDKLHREIFGWFKGVNIQPMGFNIYLFKFEIDNYLSSGSKSDVDNIEINEFS